MAEAILRLTAGDRFEALSAGFIPAGYIHPLAIEAVRSLGASAEGQRSKSWDELAGEPLDLVITLCEDTAGEPCPQWQGAPIQVNWLLSDPAAFLATEEQQLEFAHRIAGRLQAKIKAMVQLDWSQERSELKKQLELLGEI